MTTTNPAAKRFISRDAVNRAARTLWQGVGIDVLVAIALVLGTYFASADGWGAIEWGVLSFSVGKSVVQAVVAYVTRRYVDTSRRLQSSSLALTPPQPLVTPALPPSTSPADIGSQNP